MENKDQDILLYPPTMPAPHQENKQHGGTGRKREAELSRGWIAHCQLMVVLNGFVFLIICLSGLQASSETNMGSALIFVLCMIMYAVLFIPSLMGLTFIKSTPVSIRLYLAAMCAAPLSVMVAAWLS